MTLFSVRTLVLLVLALAAVRLVSIGLYPLGDTTEARYGEVARIMATDGDWITPYNDPGVPFWAKPPLSFWAQALTMKLFGVNAFAARLSSVLFGLLIVWLAFTLARRGDGERPATEAWVAALVLMTAPLSFLMAGTVMTDMALVAATTLSMTAFWFAWRPESTRRPRRWGYVFFVGLGLALLAKGPVGVVLSGAGVGLFWLISPGRWANLKLIWQRLPWIGGTALMLALALPWYVEAEVRTPGFIEYFIVGEHFKRFVVPGWQGDMFGNAHVEPRGMIWVFMAYAIGPWLLLALWTMWARWRRPPPAPAIAFDRYLLAWTLATPIFFTAAGNTIWSYVLPALPAFALWLARRCPEDSGVVRWSVPATGGLLLVLFSVLFLIVAPSESQQVRRSTAPMLAAKDRAATDPAAPLFVVGRLRHSTKFYSRATAIAIEPQDVARVLQQTGEVFVVVEQGMLPDMPPGLRERAQQVGVFDGLVLLRLPGAPH